MQSLTQKSSSVFEKSRKQIVSDGQSFVTDPDRKVDAMRVEGIPEIKGIY